MAKFEILMSVMNQVGYSVVEKSKCMSNVLIINQIDRNEVQNFDFNGYFIRMISTTERGLSNSRNMAIRNSNAEICLLADDDEQFVDGYEKIILSAFKDKPNADIIAFDVVNINKIKRYTKFFNYDSVGKKTRKSPRFKSYGSVRIVFKRKKIIENNIWFNSKFGSGSGCISAGEETVWLRQARKSGLKVYHCPQTIALINDGESKWFKGFNEKYFYDLGACLSVTYPLLKHIFKYYYLINIRGTKMASLTKLKYLNLGIKYFGKYKISYEEYKNYKN